MTRLKTALLAGLLLLLVPPHEASATAAEAAQDVDACAMLEIRYHESIAAQGFLGLHTPEARPEVTRDAFNANLAAFNAASASAEITAPRDLDFDWPLVCARARERGLSVLWIGCHADSRAAGGEYAGALARRRRLIDVVTAECVVSSWNESKHPSWGELRKAALFHSGSDEKTIYPDDQGWEGDRHEQLKCPEVREALYRSALRNSVGVLVYGVSSFERY